MSKINNNLGVAGYIVGASDGKKIWHGRRTFGKLQECRAIYTQYKTAETEIKNLQKNDNDVSDLVVFPVTLTLGKAIQPTIRKKPKGFVIKFEQTDKDYEGKKRVQYSFWKGNKKKPDVTWTHMERTPQGSWIHGKEPDLSLIVRLFNRYEDTAFKASVFKTEVEAEKVLMIFKQAQQDGLGVSFDQFNEDMTDQQFGYMDSRMSYEEAVKLRNKQAHDTYDTLMITLNNSVVQIKEV